MSSSASVHKRCVPIDVSQVGVDFAVLGEQPGHSNVPATAGDGKSRHPIFISNVDVDVLGEEELGQIAAGGGGRLARCTHLHKRCAAIHLGVTVVEVDAGHFDG